MSVLAYGFFSVLLPLVMELAANYKNCADRRKGFFSAAAVTVVANMVAAIFWVLFKNRVTKFECLLVSCVVGIVLAWVVLPIVRTRKLDHIHILKATCFGCVVIAVYSILTHGQTVIHSDTATATLLAKSQISDGSLFPAGWNYANGDVWVLNQSLVTLPFVFFMENQSYARMLGSAVYVLIAVAAVAYHSKAGFQDRSWLLAIPLFLIFSCYGFKQINSSSDVTLYQAATTGHMIWNTLCCLMLFKIKTGPAKKRHYVLFLGLMVLLAIGGIRVLVEQTLPLLLTCALLTYMDLREKEQVNWGSTLARIGRIAAVILIPVVAGLGIHKIIGASHNMNPSPQSALVYMGSVRECLDNFNVVIANLFSCFGFENGAELISLTGVRNLISIVICVVVVFVVPILQARKLKQENEYIRFFYTYCMIHNLAMLTIITLFSGKQILHYVVTSIYILLLISARYIYVYWFNQINFRKYVWTALFVIAAAVECLTMLAASIGWTNTLASYKEFNQQLRNRGLTKGYATYWNAYKNEIYSDLQIRYGEVKVHSDALEAGRWLVDDEVYVPNDGKSFLLLSNQERQLIEEKLEVKFGTPAEYFVLDGLHVYIFDYDIAENFGW